MHSYQKPNGSYCAVVQANGKRIKVTAPTKKECDRKAAQALIDLGGALRPTETTVGQLLDEWIESGGRKGELSPTFIADIESLIPRLPGAFTELTVDRVDNVIVSALYRSLRRRAHDPRCTPKRCGLDCPLSVHRVRRVHTVLHAAFAYAVTEMHLLKVNPIEAVNAPAAPPTEVKAPTAAEVGKILTAVEGTLFGLYLLLSAVSGARRGEVVGLQWADVTGSQVQIRRSRTETNRGLQTRAGKTAAKGHRAVALPGYLADALAAHELAQRTLAMAAGLPRPVWVFSHDAGQSPWRPGFVSHKFRELCIKVGLSTVIKAEDSPTGKRITETSVRLHDLRHFMATQMLQGGVPLSTVAHRLGHSSETTTARVYSDYLQAADQHAAELLERVMRRG